MHAYGVDLSDRSFKYLRLRDTPHGIKVGNFGKQLIPEGFIERGEIKNAKELSEFLKNNCRNLGIEFAAISLPDEKAYLSFMKLPTMEKKFLYDAVESQLEEYIPLAASDAVFDYEIISQNQGGDIKIVVVAYPRAIIESYKDVFYDAGVQPIAFEMETLAMRRSVLGDRHEGTEMVVDFGKTHTSFSIFHNGTARFNSTIPVAGDNLNEALRKRFSVDYDQAEQIKEGKGMMKTKGNEEVFNALLPVASAIAEEIQRHIIYWNSHAEHLGVSGQKEIEGVILVGGDANLLGLIEYLSFEIKLPVSIANPWVNIASFEDYVPEIKKNESLIYANVIGLALGAIRATDI